MYDETQHKMRAIKARDPASFQRQYDEVAHEVDKYNPEIDSDFRDGYFYAIFRYEMNIPHPETVNDVFKLAGISHTCGECPYLEMGTDNRRKLWPCEYADTGITSKDSPACEVLLKGLMKGTVRLRNWEAENDD